MVNYQPAVFAASLQLHDFDPPIHTIKQESVIGRFGICTLKYLAKKFGELIDQSKDY